MKHLECPLYRLLISSRSSNKYGRRIGNSCFWLVNFFKKCSPLKPLGQMSRNLVGSIYESFSIRLPHFITIGQKFVTMPSNSCFWKEGKTIFSSETRGAMHCIFVGMMYERSCTKLPYFLPIIQLIWPP